MSQDHDDTIAAIATGVDGAIAVIRISGPAATDLAARVWHGRRRLTPRRLQLGLVRDAAGQPLDQCLAVWMPGPHSYTGEDVVELQLHGGPQTARSVLERVLQAGARHAEPGEFTRRAFVNGRLDLTQAEAVADIITAHSELALHSANRQLQGRLGRRVNVLYERLYRIHAELEVRLDFTDEDLDWLTPAQLEEEFSHAAAEIQDLLQSRRAGEVLRHGIRLVLAGIPNAGKSSLLNLILGQDRAIVTEIPGTTRDTLEELASIRGIPIRLIDTAGLRETTDRIERHGVDRSYASIAGAQIVLWILDATQPFAEQRIAPERLQQKTVLAVANKADLAPGNTFANDLPTPALPLCAVTGDGLPAIIDAIERLVWGQPLAAEPEIAVSARHSAELTAAADRLQRARDLLPSARWEVLALELRAALDALGRITGRTVEPDILDYIFSRFCLGK